MRTVIDTNVFIAGLLWRGPPHDLFLFARSGVLALFSSSALLSELAEVLGRKKFAAIFARVGSSPEQLIDQVRQLVEVVEPTPLSRPVCRDPDDDEVLALALAARAQLIVSGDDDLLVLRQFEGIPIVTPAQALALLGVD